MGPQQWTERLIAVLRKRSYREGDFTLASGKKSSFYIDVKTTALFPEGAALIGKLIYAKAQEKGWRMDAVAGLTLGADPLVMAAALEAHQHGRVWPALMVRKESKEHGTLKYVEGIENILPGARVLVLEDVTTTGGSSLTAVERLRAEGLCPFAVLTVVDREQGGARKIQDAGLEFESLVKISELRA